MTKSNRSGSWGLAVTLLATLGGPTTVPPDAGRPAPGTDAGTGLPAAETGGTETPVAFRYPPRIVPQRPGLARRVVVEVEGKGRRAATSLTSI